MWLSDDGVALGSQATEGRSPVEATNSTDVETLDEEYSSQEDSMHIPKQDFRDICLGLALSY